MIDVFTLSYDSIQDIVDSLRIQLTKKTVVFRLSDNVCSLVLDIAFIIDSSGSIGGNNWIRMKRFVKSVVSKLDVGSSSTRIAAIAYSTNPKVVWRFNDYQDKDMVNRVLDNMAWQSGFTYTDRALLLAGNDLFQSFNGMRVNVTKVS